MQRTKSVHDLSRCACGATAHALSLPRALDGRRCTGSSSIVVDDDQEVDQLEVVQTLVVVKQGNGLVGREQAVDVVVGLDVVEQVQLGGLVSAKALKIKTLLLI
jgi:hypothetical protein